MVELASEQVLPWDAIAVLCYAAAVIPLQWITLTSPVRIVLVAPALLFLPGFTLTTVLFPGGSAEDGAIAKNGMSQLGIIERAALSVGLSVGLLPLLAFGFDLVLGQIVGPTIVVTAVFSAVMALLGGVRRLRLPKADRFEIPVVRWFDMMTTVMRDESTRTIVVNVVLAGSVVLAVGAVGIAFAVPQEGATFTDFAVGTEQGGEFVTDGYPEDLAVGEVADTAVLIENNEGDPTEYYVVTRFERVQDDTVTAVQDADEFTVTVGSGETVTESYSVTRSMTGDNVRLRFFLYRDEPPTNPQPETAYRTVHLWVDVE